MISPVKISLHFDSELMYNEFGFTSCKFLMYDYILVAQTKKKYYAIWLRTNSHIFEGTIEIVVVKNH